MCKDFCQAPLLFCKRDAVTVPFFFQHLCINGLAADHDHQVRQRVEYGLRFKDPEHLIRCNLFQLSGMLCPFNDFTVQQGEEYFTVRRKFFPFSIFSVRFQDQFLPDSGNIVKLQFSPAALGEKAVLPGDCQVFGRVFSVILICPPMLRLSIRPARFTASPMHPYFILFPDPILPTTHTPELIPMPMDSSG